MSSLRDRVPTPRTDLGLVNALVLLTLVALLVVDAPWQVDVALGVPFLLLYPGYALTAALFPEAPRAEPPVDGRSTPGWAARVAISLGLSAVVVAVTGLLASWTVGVRLGPVVLAVTAVTLLSTTVASARRRSLPPAHRANPLDAAAGPLPGPSPGLSRLQAATGLVAALVLVGAVAYAGAAPGPGQPYSEFYLLSEGGDGSLAASDYPTTFVAGQGHPLHVAIENHERQPVTYEVVVLAQAVRGDGTVLAEEPVDRFEVGLAPGERAVVERRVAPSTPGEGVRLQFLAFEDGAPADPSAERADLSLHLWIDVVER